MTAIYAYNKKGLQILWHKVYSDYGNREDTLNAIYKTYGKEQWESKCKQFGFNI